MPINLGSLAAAGAGLGGGPGGFLGGLANLATAVTPIISAFRRPPVPAPAPAVVPAQAFPTAPMAGVLGRLLAPVGAAVSVTELLRLARQNSGQSVSVRKIVEAARVCGLETAAATFGLSTTQVCQIIVSRRPRRRRGISAADLRRTRSTIRKITNMRRDLKKLAGRA